MIRSIALLTDFGHQDVFVGVLKGVIHSINPWASIIDLCHEVPPQDTHSGAFDLNIAHSYFPKDTVFCAVVDPGVGSQRRAVALKTEHYFFVGPDNGLLYPAASQDGIQRAVNLTQEAFFLDTVSQTFHGRDIFAPVAAHLSLGREITSLGDELDLSDLVRFEFPEPHPLDDGQGTQLNVIHTDVYGNLTLNIKPSVFDTHAQGGFCLAAGAHTITQCHKAYDHAPENIPFVLEASSGYMEIAVKNKSAARTLGLSTGDSLVLA